MLKDYLCHKQVKAKPMNKHEFYTNIKCVDCKEENEEGYYVLYNDGYESWSPKKAFEEGYNLIPDKEC